MLSLLKLYGIFLILDYANCSECLVLCFEFGFLRIAGSKPGTSPIFNISSSTPAPARKTGADDFLNSENDKNDFDW